MPIITDIKALSQNFSTKLIFIFSENDIYINLKESDTVLSKKSLPSEDFFRKCIMEKKVSSWYIETGLNYAACMLNKKCKELQDYKKIPLREFFWNAKTDQEKIKGTHSYIGNIAARAHAFLRLNEIYTYCPKCGTKMQPDSVEIAKVCPNCGRKDFPHIEPAVIVLVSKGNEILLVKNKNRSFDFFGCVSGFVEHGESLEECVVREVKEETNINITNIKYAGSQAWPFPDQLMLAFTADYESGEIKLQEEELDDGGWFSKLNLPTIPKPGSVAYNLIMGHFNTNN
ncbi:MAG: NAD(+) diphosphatase [Treponema sp.]|nr:NAD(+) diphosphatase [Treponema sp.]